MKIQIPLREIVLGPQGTAKAVFPIELRGFSGEITLNGENRHEGKKIFIRPINTFREGDLLTVEFKEGPFGGEPL